ncbi:MAG: hypothetical protein KAU31_01265, partial [Spirochaetaceae bacterium]|nr:hypothetical protein [Spirochaetaceae bacterium]
TGDARNLTCSAGVAEYFPVYVSERALWFTANLNGPLALYELNLADGAVTHLLTDRDGVFYATPLGDGAVYASYSSTGPSVKQVDHLAREVVDWPGGVTPDAAVSGGVASSAPGPAADGSEILPSRRFVDWPRPDLWLPIVLPGRAESGIGVEVGGLVVASSPLEKNLGFLMSWVNVSSWVPSIALQLLHFSGPWQAVVNLASAPGYQDETGLRARLESSASVALGREIARWGVLRRRHSVTALVSGSVTSASAEGEALSDFFAGPSEERLGAGATLAYASARQTRAADLFGPAGTSASVVGSYGAAMDLLAGSLGAPVLGVVGVVGLRIPTGAAMSNLLLTAKTPELSTSIDAPRGSAISLIGGTPAATDPALVARIGIDSPALLLDLGFRGFSLTRLGLSAYLQQVADYVTDGIELRAETSAAIELVAKVGYLSAP